MSYKVHFHTELDKKGCTNKAKSGYVVLRMDGSFVHEKIHEDKASADKHLELLKAFGFDK